MRISDSLRVKYITLYEVTGETACSTEHIRWFAKKTEAEKWISEQSDSNVRHMIVVRRVMDVWELPPVESR
jgi:hypothetical protein